MSAKQAELPPVMILCGGQGTRLRDLTELLPKPMVPIGEQPVLWHIMRGFAAFGCRRFILCLGYKREEFIDYFLNFQARSCDMTITLGRKNGIVYHGSSAEADWEVTLADTGIDTMTGGRVLRASRYLKPQDREFFLTYGDGVADIDVAALLEFHRRNGKQLTVSTRRGVSERCSSTIGGESLDSPKRKCAAKGGSTAVSWCWSGILSPATWRGARIAISSSGRWPRRCGTERWPRTGTRVSGSAWIRRASTVS